MTCFMIFMKKISLLISLILLFQILFSQLKKDSAVKVIAHINYQSDDKNLIPFSLNNPLTLNDFAGPVNSNVTGDAETYSGILLKYYFSHEHGQLLISVDVFPFFDKSKSWCRKESRNDKTLSHEQIHFYITAIKACEMIEEIEKYHFSIRGYKMELQKISNDKNLEAEEYQNKYDFETKHGRKIEMQQKWNEKITQSLSEQLCFK